MEDMAMSAVTFPNIVRIVRREPTQQAQNSSSVFNDPVSHLRASPSSWTASHPGRISARAVV